MTRKVLITGGAGFIGSHLSRRRPDISLARELLDGSPKVSLREGLQPTIDYFRGISRGR